MDEHPAIPGYSGPKTATSSIAAASRALGGPPAPAPEGNPGARPVAFGEGISVAWVGGAFVGLLLMVGLMALANGASVNHDDQLWLMTGALGLGIVNTGICLHKSFEPAVRRITEPLARSILVPATIVRVETMRRIARKPTVRFTDQHGATHEAELAPVTTALAEGQQLVVRYDPQDPTWVIQDAGGSGGAADIRKLGRVGFLLAASGVPLVLFSAIELFI